MLLRLLISFLLFLLPVAAQGFRPAAFPLALRSPYLNAWQPAGASLNVDWPHPFDLQHILGHVIFIRVDGAQFEILGQEGNSTTLTDVTITPTQTTLIVQAGPSMQVTLTYFSPIEPQDLALQSFPFTYVSINAQATDGKSHQVQFYTDISGEWASGSLSSLITWNTTQTSSGVIVHEIQRSAPQPMQEIASVAEDGVVYYATMPSQSNIPTTYQTGADVDLRTQFTANGKLLDTQDTSFRAVQDRFPVFAFAWDAGTIQEPMTTPVVWAIGIVRDPAVVYTTSSGNQTRSSLFFSKFPTVQNGIESFLSDFSKAQSRANSLDQKITTAAKAVSSNYADIVSLSTRMVTAASEITVSKVGSAYNVSDVMMFMKDIGTSRRVNPVEVLYASFPTFMYLNATWGAYLLEPLLRYQRDLPSGKPFSISDLGTNFPVASGNTSPAIFRAIDDSSSMLIMAWAQARFSGDASLIERYYDIFKSWTEYLIPNTLTPTGYITSDGLDNSNTTNLALKGIVGIRVMSEISKALGVNDDASKYLSTATSYAQQWQTLAGSTGHLESTYGSSASWALVYNLLPDKWLGLNLIDQKIYAAQSSWYSSEVSAAGHFGLPYDSGDANTAKAQWTLWAAATINDTTTRNALIDLVHVKVADNSTPGVFPASYDPSTGKAISGTGSPALGASFSVLALGLPPLSVTGSVNLPSGGSSKSAVGPIVGGVVGGLAAIALLALAFVVCRKRRRQKDRYPAHSDGFGLHPVTPPRPTPSHVDSRPPSPTPFPLHHQSQPSYSGSSSFGGSSSSGSGGALLRGASNSTRSRQAPPLPRKGAMRSNELVSPVSEDADANVLREEVENLRREMDELRARGQYEPPPEYA